MGRVAAPHGVRGAFKVQPLSEDPESLLDFAQWWLRARDADAWRPYKVTSSRLHSGAIVADDSYTTPEDTTLTVVAPGS